MSEIERIVNQNAEDRRRARDRSEHARAVCHTASTACYLLCGCTCTSSAVLYWIGHPVVCLVVVAAACILLAFGLWFDEQSRTERK